MTEMSVTGQKRSLKAMSNCIDWSIIFHMKLPSNLLGAKNYRLWHLIRIGELANH